MYSQDLPEGNIYFPTLKEYDRLYGCSLFVCRKALLRVNPYL